MLKVQQVKLSLVLLYLIIVLIVCSAQMVPLEPTSTPQGTLRVPINAAEAIKLAKLAAANLPSPPRMYNKPIVLDLTLWPDEPDVTVQHTGYICADVLMQFTTLSHVQGEDQFITFLITGMSTFSNSDEHRWVFKVNPDGQATFMDEQGARLLYHPYDCG